MLVHTSRPLRCALEDDSPAIEVLDGLIRELPQTVDVLDVGDCDVMSRFEFGKDSIYDDGIVGAGGQVIDLVDLSSTPVDALSEAGFLCEELQPRHLC